MGRLSPVSELAVSSPLGLGGAAIAVALGCVACETPAPAARRERTNAIAGSVSKPGPTPSPTASAPAASARRAPRKLCTGQAEGDTPDTLDLARAAGGATPPPALKIGGRWVWINVWAAWCEPCKKEMPMLLAWRDRLKASGVDLQLAFVSIDDDERELTRFLDKQPATGVRASYWLMGEGTRTTWFESIGYTQEPTLPVHAFVNPRGKLACRVDGVLEPPDYASLERLLRSGG